MTPWVEVDADFEGIQGSKITMGLAMARANRRDVLADGESQVMHRFILMNFRKWFRSNVGQPKSMSTHADSHGHNHTISISSSSRLFAGG